MTYAGRVSIKLYGEMVGVLKLRGKMKYNASWQKSHKKLTQQHS